MLGGARARVKPNSTFPPPDMCPRGPPPLHPRTFPPPWLCDWTVGRPGPSLSDELTAFTEFVKEHRASLPRRLIVMEQPVQHFNHWQGYFPGGSLELGAGDAVL